MSDSQIPVELFLLLLLAASATAVSVKWIRMPYAIALVITGLLIGLLHLLPSIHMTPGVVLFVFLPALLFEASWNLDIKALRQDWLPIAVLSVIGVLVSMSVIAAILFLGGSTALTTALLFGAIISATDPISVIALFKQIGIDKRLIMLLEGESLFNDATAVALFSAVLVLFQSGSEQVLLKELWTFPMALGGGALIGFVTGALGSLLSNIFEDSLLETTLTIITAYGTFLIASRAGVSPVIAVIIAGMIVGNYGSRTGMSKETRSTVDFFWEYSAFLANSLLFLLIGLEISPNLLWGENWLIGIAVVAVFVGRIIAVLGLALPLSRTKLRIPMKWTPVLVWGGLRGALCMALALSLPATIADRELIINMTFGVVLFTLLIPGLTMQYLVRILRIEG